MNVNINNKNATNLLDNYRYYLQNIKNRNNEPYKKSAIDTYVNDTKKIIEILTIHNINWEDINLEDYDEKAVYIELLEEYFLSNGEHAFKDITKNVRNYINHLIRFKNYVLTEIQNRSLLENQFEYDYNVTLNTEGKKRLRFVSTYERNQKLREQAINIHGTSCQVCGFNFEKVYGELGKDFIEVHHLIPLNFSEDEVSTNPETDLACVCSNCHKMFHRKRNEILNLNDLRSIVENNRLL